MGGAQNSPRVEEKSWIKASRDQPPGFFCALLWVILRPEEVKLMKKDEKKYQQPVTMKTKKAIIKIYRPQITEEEKNRILEEIARIKATW